MPNRDDAPILTLSKLALRKLVVELEAQLKDEVWARKTIEADIRTAGGSVTEHDGGMSESPSQTRRKPHAWLPALSDARHSPSGRSGAVGRGGFVSKRDYRKAKKSLAAIERDIARIAGKKPRRIREK